jgi:hypothetical protein
MFGFLTYVAVLVTLVVGSVLRPPMALVGVLCLFGLKQWGQSASPLLAQYPLLTNFAIGALTFVAVLRAAFRRSCVFCRFPPAAICSLCLLLYAFVSLTWSMDVDSGLEVFALTTPYILVISFLAPLVIDDFRDLKAAFGWLTLIGGVICFLAVVFGTWGTRGLGVAFTAPMGSLGDGGAISAETNPLALAQLGGSVVIAAGMLLIERRRFLIKVIAIGAIPFALAAIIRSGSRGELIAALPAFLVAASVALKLRGFRSGAALTLLTLLITGMGWWATSLVEVDKTRWLGSDLAAHDVAGRFEMAGALLQAASAHPLSIFLGLGNSSSYKVLGIYPHIAILEVLAEEGLPGIALYLAILYYAARSVRRAARALADDPADRIALAILAGLFVYAVVLSWKEGGLFSPYPLCYAIMLGRLELVNVQSSRPSTLLASPLRTFPNLMR